jgi:aldehyde dehydrogenase (NAD+)
MALQLALNIEDLSDQVRESFFIRGEWLSPASVDRLDLVSPVTEEVFLSTPAGSIADMEAAIAAARVAFDAGTWPRFSAPERAPYLRRIADEVRLRRSLFQQVWTAQVGAPYSFASTITGLCASYFDFYADAAETFKFEEVRPTFRGSVKVVREPVGVAALIVPWNAPLALLVQKLAAALAAGCTVVIKPSPETPLDALILAECIAAAGIPGGVVNIVPAMTPVGDFLVRHPAIDKVSFTGSTAAGKHIAAVCAERIARVSLELGGKSAAILCDDADLDDAIPALLPFTTPFSGQICFSQTRVLVSEKRHDEVLDRLSQAVSHLKVGDPLDDETQVGPLATARQLERVQGYIEKGKSEGALLVQGGGRVEGRNRGYYLEPTIFDRVTTDMTIGREEIFGPVLSVMAYADEADAVRIANATDYGLSGSVFSTDIARAEAIARQVRTGTISVNEFQLDPIAPFGGFKQSGLGREGGIEGLHEYLEFKSIFLPVSLGRDVINPK